MKLDKQEIMSTDARGQRSDGSDEITWSLRLLHQHHEWPTNLRGKEYPCTLFLQCPIPPTSPDFTSLFSCSLSEAVDIIEGSSLSNILSLSVSMLGVSYHKNSLFL